MAQTDHNTRFPGLPDPAQVATDDAALAEFLDAARERVLEPDAALMARILQAGLAEQVAIAASRSLLARPVPAPRGFSAWLGNLGGWGAATGLASVTLVGLWLGFIPPTGLAGMADGVLGTSLSGSSTVVDQVDLLPNFETYLAEG